MKISYLDIDSKLPNLAIMKHAGYMRKQGHEVELNAVEADRYFASIIFSKNRYIGEGLKKMYGARVKIGGTGWDIDVKLPEEIEREKPFYELYGIDYGMGFTSRGCIRNCEFCVVPRKEGKILSVATIEEMANPKSNFLVLLDNNFLASPGWLDRCKEIYKGDYKVSFCQGLDVRLVNEGNAWWLARMKLRNLHNTNNRIYFAWDNIKDEKRIREGVKTLSGAGIKPYRLVFYILTGFNSTLEEDLYRVNEIIGWGCEPYVMVYNKGEINHNTNLKHLQCWANAKIYKSCTFEEYKPYEKEKYQIKLR